jgi:signal transduction histidine kinase/CheY-like chemotaxis protein/HPt (histidine-containing phosphotransfer) domain-containing protein
MNKPSDSKSSISLDLALQLFPFVMCLDSKGDIKYCSERLRSNFEYNPLGENIFDLFSIEGAGKQAQASRSLRNSDIGTLFLLSNFDLGIGLRGQLINGMYDKESVFLFVGSPWLSWMYDNLEKPDVSVNDFPVIDSQLEYQMNICASSEMLKDLKVFSARLEKSRSEAETASLAKTKFVRHVSHEIRTPLNGLITALRLLQDESEAHRKARLFEIANSTAAALLDLVSDVLDFSRLEEGVFASVREEINIAQFMREIEAGLSARAAEKDMYLQFDVSLSVPSCVQLDKRSLQRILYNLIGNAIKYSQSDLVVIRVECVKNRLRFEVEDFGVGLSADELMLIFEPFWVSDSNKSNEQSTGLGLPIVKETIEKLDGNLTVDSMPGQGARFRFDLPLSDSEEVRLASSSEIESTAPVDSNFRGSILLVDDNSINLELAQILLRKLGLEVTTATNGEEAVLAEAENFYDLILMDIEMPVLNGIDAARRIRKSGTNAGVPIVAMTANVSAQDVESYLAAGMNDSISKPVVNESLLRVIEQFLPAASLDQSGDQQQNSTPGTASAETTVLDVDVFAMLVDNVGADNIRRIFEMYRDETDRQIKELTIAMQSQEHDQARRIAHRIASSTLSFGLNRLGYMLRKLEKDAENQQPFSKGVNEDLLACFAKSMSLLESACPGGVGGAAD